MGHKDIKMTVRYSHLALKHTLAAVQRLSEALSETRTDIKTSTEQEQPIQTETQYLQ